MLNTLKQLIWKIIPQRYTAKCTLFDIIDPVLASLWYGFPSKKMKIIGITGTDGKTTTSFLLHSILKTWGKKTGLISTIKIAYGDKEYSGGLHVTTPDPWKLQKVLREMADAGCEYVVMEVTSHAIHQKRIWGIDFAIAGLTNITHEHLDVHGGSFEQYKQTKLSFIQKAPVFFKTEELSDKFIQDIHLHITGDYNYLNAKLAAAIANELGVPHEIIKQGLEAVTEVPGRMHVVYKGEFTVIIDFAHTPNGLETALISGKKLVKHNGRLIVVFGAAGERDQYKRPMMGSIAAQNADIMVITAEDPRSESIENISNAIKQGAIEKGAKENETLFTITDRQEAINYAINTLAQPNDVIMITGKGPEQSMNFGGKEKPWNEYEAVVKALDSNQQSVS